MTRLAEQCVDVHVGGAPGGPEEHQVLPVADPWHQLEAQQVGQAEHRVTKWLWVSAWIMVGCSSDSFFSSPSMMLPDHGPVVVVDEREQVGLVACDLRPRKRIAHPELVGTRGLEPAEGLRRLPVRAGTVR